MGEIRLEQLWFTLLHSSDSRALWHPEPVPAGPPALYDCHAHPVLLLQAGQDLSPGHGRAGRAGAERQAVIHSKEDILQ